jgi:single-strand DNA-binding protein
MICTATIIGNLVRDPEMQTIQKNGEELTLTKFSLAVNHGFGDDAAVSFFDFVAWNGLGKSLAQYRKKGDQVGVVAEPRQERWEAKDGGGSRSRVTFTAKTIEFLRSKGDGGAPREEPPAEVIAQSAPTTAPAAAEPVATEAPVEAPATQESLEVPF